MERRTDIEIDFVKVPVRLEDNIHVVQACYLQRSLYSEDLMKIWSYVLVPPEMVQQSISCDCQDYIQMFLIAERT